jgi:hypothetical protein
MLDGAACAVPPLVRAVACAAALACSVTASGQDAAGGASVQSDLETLRSEIEGLREDNERMRTEVDELRAPNDADWLTEARADEIREIVNDVLADADTRSSLLANGVMAGWSDHFFLASADGRFKLQVDGMQQIRYLWNYHDEPDTHLRGFELTRTKLTFRGHVFNKDLTYLVRTDVTRNEPGLVTGLFFLQDAWVRYQLNSDWSVRLGQFKLPYNREELVPASHQQAVERSLVNESLNLGRSQGVELLWAPEGGDKRMAVVFSDTATDSMGGFALTGRNGAYQNALLPDTEWALTGRYEQLITRTWEQFNDITSPMTDEYGILIGLGVHAEQGEHTGQFTRNADEADWYGYTADVSIEWGGANVFGSWTHNYVDNASVNANFFGVVAQAGVYLTPKAELFTRFEYGWISAPNANFNDLTLITFGGNYYFEGHDVKWSTDIGFGISKIDQSWDFDIAGYRRDIAADPPQIVFRTQFQLLW